MGQCRWKAVEDGRRFCSNGRILTSVFEELWSAAAVSGRTFSAPNQLKSCNHKRVGIAWSLTTEADYKGVFFFLLECVRDKIKI